MGRKAKGLSAIRRPQEVKSSVVNTWKLNESETILGASYPMNEMYVYIIDGVLARCEQTMNVSQYKAIYKANEIRRCDLFGHPGAKLGDRVE